MSEIDFDKKKEQQEHQPSPLDGPGLALDPAWFEQPANEPLFARHVMTTPLHLVASTESRTNRWGAWNGYTLADVYTGFDQEYDVLRTRAGLSDISPLVKYRISGKDAGPYLDRLLTRTVAVVPVNCAVRAVMCDGNGNLVTEGLLFRMGEQDFRLVVRSSNLDWLLENADGFEVNVEDVSGTIAALSLAGPLATSVLQAVGIYDLDALSKNHAHWVELGGMPAYLSRTGMMGGIEYELWMDPSDAPIIWQRLLEAGVPYGVRAVGMAVRNVARLENGVVLEGVDYGNAFEANEKLPARSPFDLGLGSLVDLDNPVFNGRRALTEIASRGSEHVIVGIEIEADQNATWGAVCVGDHPVGHVSSTAWSPSLQRHIALATLKTSALGSSDGFSIEVVCAGTADKRLPATLAKRPFLTFS